MFQALGLYAVKGSKAEGGTFPRLGKTLSSCRTLECQEKLKFTVTPSLHRLLQIQKFLFLDDDHFSPSSHRR